LALWVILDSIREEKAKKAAAAVQNEKKESADE
jgi:hypothetical protein